MVNKKKSVLIAYLQSFESVAVAFSSGVDSTFLLAAAIEALGEDHVIAITAKSCLFPERELTEAKQFCEENHVRHMIFEANELAIEGFAHNPKNRCYLCKYDLFENMLSIAKENGITTIVEGSNIDDNGDYRPGLMAIKELGVKSPLQVAGLTKAEIRKLSKEMGLPTWKKQSFACLASRFVYGETIDEKKLDMVDQAEQFLLDMGFHQLRVRIHGDEKDFMARIEVIESEFTKVMDETMRQEIYRYFKELGFTYITLDLLGYRTGSMNEILK